MFVIYRMILIYSVSVLLFGQSFSQHKIVRQTHQVWNSDKVKWDLTEVTNWKYDSQGRKIFYLLENDFSPEEKPQYVDKSIYEFYPNGKLSSYHHERINRSNYIHIAREYTYNDNGHVSDILQKYFSHTGELGRTQKLKIEYSPDGKKISEKVFERYRDDDTYSLFQVTDTLFDENGCKTAIIYKHYHQDIPTLTIVQQELWTRDSTCRLLTYDDLYWISAYSVETDPPIPGK